VYFPFGAGTRMCIGNTFAMMETVLVLATLAQRYRFTLFPGHEVVPWPTFTLRPHHGVKAILARR
jgi:cytochrome P450